jgi:glycosyltransferase involved in cell wall biosynthesis/flagellin-specific chaperone FliS
MEETSKELLEQIGGIKEKIEEFINKGEVEAAKEAIHLYEQRVNNDIDICSMKAVILIIEQKFEEAKLMLIDGIGKSSFNTDLLFNLGYVFEHLGEFQRAYDIYTGLKILLNGENDQHVSEALLRANQYSIQKFETNNNTNAEKQNSVFSLIQCSYYNHAYLVNKKENIINKQNSSIGEDTSPLRVLHGTIEIANQMNCLVEGLKKHGVSTKSLSYYPSYLKYGVDFSYDISKELDREKVNCFLQEITLKAIDSFDVFHFHFGTTLTTGHSDLALLKNVGKKVFMHHWGTDVRILSRAKEINRFAIVKNVNEKQIKDRLEFLSTYIDQCIVADAELYEYVKPYYKNVHFIPQAIDLKAYSPLKDFKMRNRKPVIVHAPTSPEFKGTNYILKAIEELNGENDFEFKLVRNLSHDEAKKIYQEADIIIDQIHAGAYGLLSLEVMAMGKPVICYISDFMRDYYPKDLPIISANPENIKDKIKYLLKDTELRTELGNKGRAYVEKYHGMEKVSKILLDLYLNN